MKHEKTYKPLPNGAGQIVCLCGWESPSVDDSQAFTLGRKQKKVEQYFEEHLAAVAPRSDAPQVETTMVEPAQEQAVTPAHRPPARKEKSKEKRA